MMTTSMEQLSGDMAMESNSTIAPEAEKSWPEVLMMVIPPAVVVLGTLGNALTLAVMLRQKYRRLSTSVYLMSLCVVDTLYLYVSRLTVHGWEASTARNMFVDSEWSCKVLEGLGFISTSCSAWLIVAVTLERVIAVAVPHKAKALCTRKRAWQIVVTIVGTFCALYIVVFVVYGVKPNPTAGSGYECYMKDDYGKLTHLLVFLLYLFFYSFVPFCVLMVSNLIIVIKLIQYNRERAATTGREASSSDDSDTRRLTIMLVVISCYFVVATLPLRIFWATHSISQYLDAPVDASKYSHAAVVLSLRTLANSNHAINFILYCVSGRPFRRELMLMFGCGQNTDSGQTSGASGYNTKETNSKY